MGVSFLVMQNFFDWWQDVQLLESSLQLLGPGLINHGAKDLGGTNLLLILLVMSLKV